MFHQNYIQHVQKGFSILEVLIAAIIFVTFGTSAVVSVISSIDANRLGQETTIASQYNAEAIDAVRSIKNQSYTTLSSLSNTYCTSGSGLTKIGGLWAFNASGTSDILASDNRFTRIIKVCSVQRDSSGNIVSSGGIIDANTMNVSVTTTWNFNTVRQNSQTLSTYFTNWRTLKGGMLVYGDGGTTKDTVSYKVFNASTNTWGASANVGIFTGGTNKVLEVDRLYSSHTRNEKILLSRHWDGATQYIYISVWNGTTWTSTLLTSWASATNSFNINFDGDYLSNGDFMAIYSNNTTRPQFSTWDGTTLHNWGNVGSSALTAAPVWVSAAARPGSNELMSLYFESNKNTHTYYYNGAGYSIAANWTLVLHASTSPSTTNRMIDLEWSNTSPLTAAILFSNGNTDKQLHMKLFVANGTGGGAWGSNATEPTGTTTLSSMNLLSSTASNAFEACDKDTTFAIRCYHATFSGNAITWHAVTNNVITTTTENGPERSYDYDYESISGQFAVMVYSDNTNIPKLKKFNPISGSFGTWDTSATALNTNGNTLGTPVKTIRVNSQAQGNDMMVLIDDNNANVYTVFWDGNNNIQYTSPSGKAFTKQGTNGVASGNLWFDFAWDNY